jgi:hypothetical protein
MRPPERAPHESAPLDQEDKVLAEVRRLLDLGRTGPALAVLTPLSTAPATSARALRSAAALFARARALGEAVATFRALARRHVFEGELELAAGALQQAYAFAKVVGDAGVVAEVRADLADLLDELGYSATPSQLPPPPQPIDDAPPARAAQVDDAGDDVDDVGVEASDDEPTARPTSSRVDSESGERPMPAVVESGERPMAAVSDGAGSLARAGGEPSREEIESTVAEIDFFLELGDVDEAREIAKNFLSRAPEEPTVAAILEGIRLFETNRPPSSPLARPA